MTTVIERVTFHNEDTGFGVLKVKAKGHRDLVTVVVLIGQQKALGMAARNNRTESRFSGLLARLIGPG